jgi:F420-dependent oxidoreductase-like protein
MRLGLNLGYWGLFSDRDNIALAQEAERLGYSSVWMAEAYGSDAATVLTWIAAHTTTIGVGSGIFQIPGRTPAMTAMTAATIDTLSGGRFRLGLGVSGPQVSEGWHGVRFDRPVTRTREYVDIVRLALAGERVQYDGSEYQLPLPGGPGKALKLITGPVQERLPIYLAAIGPKNLELAGERCDGWLGVFYDVEYSADQLASVDAGRARAGRLAEPFDVTPTIYVGIGDDLAAATEPVRPYTALYLGGMGPRDHNFYAQLAGRMGFADQAATVQELYLDQKTGAAAAAVPLEFIDRTSLLGSIDRIAERMQALAKSGVTTINVNTFAATQTERIATLRAAATALEKSGVGD